MQIKLGVGTFKDADYVNIHLTFFLCLSFMCSFCVYVMQQTCLTAYQHKWSVKWPLFHSFTQSYDSLIQGRYL